LTGETDARAPLIEIRSEISCGGLLLKFSHPDSFPFREGKIMTVDLERKISVENPVTTYVVTAKDGCRVGVSTSPNENPWALAPF